MFNIFCHLPVPGAGGRARRRHAFAGAAAPQRIAAVLVACLAELGAATALAAGADAPAQAAPLPPTATRSVAATAEQALLARLKDLYPTTTFSSVGRTPLPGIYEVVMGSSIAYVGEDGRHFLFGHLFDLQRNVDLTASRPGGAGPGALLPARVEPGTPASPPARIALADLPLRNAIVRTSGTGARKLVVFFDPHCAQCRRLDADLLQLTDATVYTFLVPLQGREAREAALRHWAVHMPERALEAQVVDQNLRLARSLGIRATPTLVRTDGQVAEGAMSLPELMAWLDGDANLAKDAAPRRAAQAGLTHTP